MKLVSVESHVTSDMDPIEVWLVAIGTDSSELIVPEGMCHNVAFNSCL